MKVNKNLLNNNNDTKSFNLNWKSLDLETKIAIPIILALFIAIFGYTLFSGVLKKK